MSKKNTLFSDQVLEKIARVFGEYFSGTQITHLLHKSGIPNTWINYPNTKWRTIKEVFDRCHKNKNGDKKIESVLMIFTHPLNHKEEKNCTSLREEVVKYLTYDDLALDCKKNGKCTIAKSKQKSSLYAMHKTSHKTTQIFTLEDWERYRENYRRYMQTIETFFKNKSLPDDKLDSAYRELKKRLEECPNYLEPFLPFSSLYSAEKEWPMYALTRIFISEKFEWSSVRPDLQATYSKITDYLQETQLAQGKGGRISGAEIDGILAKYPKSKESDEFVQRMEVTHKFEKDALFVKPHLPLSAFKEIKFEHENLYFDKNQVPLVKHKHGKQVVAFIMTRAPHEKIDWSEIYDNTLGNDSDINIPKKEIGWRKIRDASEGINKKIVLEIKSKPAEKFIDWDQNCFWRTV